MNVGFIGLGYLGHTIAQRLIDCGHTLSVYNRTAAKAEDLSATVCPSPQAVAHQCQIIFLCMFDSDAVEEILEGDGGLLNTLQEGQIIVDLTTNHYQRVKRFAEQVAQQKANYLESPVLGSVVPAQKGMLTIVTSGDPSAYRQVTPILEDLGKNLFYLPDIGLASRMKLLNNLALGSFMATIAEILQLGEQTGIERETLLDILAVGGGNSGVLHAKKAKLIAEDYQPHFKSSLIYKDLHCLEDLAYELQQPLYSGALVKELFARTCQSGFADADFSAIYAMLKQR